MTKLLTRIRYALEVLTGELRFVFKDVQLSAVDRPRPGKRVVCVQDEGPPGLEQIHGWLGLEGIVVSDETADRIGAVAVLQPLEQLPLPQDNAGDVTEVYFLWAPGAWKEID